MPRQFSLNLFKTPLTYLRGGSPAYFDPCRHILVPATAEEDVRQRFVAYLIHEIGVPAHCLRTEEHLGHFRKGSRGRIDIAVCTPGGRPLAIVECKAPGGYLGNAYEQVLRYHAVAGARVLAVTNGEETRWYRVQGEQGELLRRAPSFAELSSGRLPPPAPATTMTRPDPLKPSRAHLNQLLDLGQLGEGSDPKNYPFFANLAGLFLAGDEPTLRGRRGRFTIVKSGVRDTSFGNAAGGDWPGLYRYFIVKDRHQNVQVVSFAVMGKGFEQNHPMFGNMNGHTMLLVAIDDVEKRHNSLQLDLDRFSMWGTDRVSIWHDGTLTRGKRGRVPRADVLNYVVKQSPHLLRGERIELGVLPSRRLITWSDAEVVLYNAIEYATIRDEYRRDSA